MTMFLCTHGSDYCLATATSQNTRHDVTLVASTTEELLANAFGALYVFKNDVINNHIFTNADTYLVCTDGILKFHGRTLPYSERFSVVPKTDYPTVIPLIQGKVNAWFAKAAKHVFPLLAHVDHPLQSSVYRFQPLAIDIPEDDPNQSFEGRPLLFYGVQPRAKTGLVMDDRTEWHVVTRDDRRYVEPLPAYNLEEAKHFFTRHRRRPRTNAA